MVIKINQENEMKANRMTIADLRVGDVVTITTWMIRRSKLTKVMVVYKYPEGINVVYPHSQAAMNVPFSTILSIKKENR